MFIALLCAGLLRPWIGLVGFYGWVILEPQWNWRWSIPSDFAFQKYLVASTMLGWILNGAQIPRLTESSKLGIACLGGFLLIGFISAAQSIDSRLSEFYMSNMWKIVLMAVLAVVLLDSPQKIWIAILVCSFAQGYSALRINEQYFQDGFSLYAYRPWGTKGDNNLYSNLTIPLIACSVAAYIFTDRRWIRYVAGGVGILQIHQIMLLQSRGAMLAALGMAAIIAWVMPKNTLTIRSTVLAITATLVLAGPSVVEEFSSSFASDDSRDSSADSRFYLWKAGARITADYPLLGVGPYAGQRLVPQYYEGGLDSSIKGLHNLFFDISTGFGLPATILYFAFFAIPWWQAVRLRRRMGGLDNVPPWLGASVLAVIAGIPGYIVGSMFSTGALAESPYVLASIGLATASVVERAFILQTSTAEVTGDHRYQIPEHIPSHA